MDTIMVKEAGTQTFVPSTGSDTTVGSMTEVSKVYRRTEESLREKLKELINNNDSRAEKVEKDLKDFYNSVANKYNHPIADRASFLNLMDTLEQQDDKFSQAKDIINDTNDQFFKEGDKRPYSDDFLAKQASVVDELYGALSKGDKPKESRKLGERDKGKSITIESEDNLKSGDTSDHQQSNLTKGDDEKDSEAESNSIY